MVNAYAQQSTELYHEEGEADDVLQEIFIQIWEEAGFYSPKAGKPLGWMVTIARRRAIDRLRRRQAYSRVRERYTRSASVQQTPNSPREADDVFVLNDLRQFLKKCMRVLPRLQREALELAFFKGLSHREIAIVTRAPLGTVKTRFELACRNSPMPCDRCVRRSERFYTVCRLFRGHGK